MNDESTDAGDNPGVLVHPPFLYLFGLALLIIVHTLYPLPMAPPRVLLIPGILVAAVGFVLAGWGRRTMIAAGTHINPQKPTTAIVENGPFRWTRNPLYLSISLVFLGVTLVLNEWLGIAILVVLMLVIEFGVIRREERYLDAKFGDAYRDYRRRATA